MMGSFEKKQWLLLFIALVMVGCSAGKEKYRSDVLNDLRVLEEKHAAQQKNESVSLALAHTLFDAGDFNRAAELLTSLVNAPDASAEAMLLLAQIEYLAGHYDRAETLARTCIERANGDVLKRLEPEIYLTFIYYQTNQYAKSLELFNGMDEVFEKMGADLESILSLWGMMKAFGQEQPYQIAWNGRQEDVIPFLQAEAHKLPTITVEINGTPVQAYIDTGGDLFSIPQELADSLGIEMISSFTGTFAGGNTAQSGYARAASLKIGETVIRNLPVSIRPESRCCLGTGVLRQFLPTLDYLNQQLILRPKNQQVAENEHTRNEKIVARIPFMLMATHFIIAKGHLNAQENLTFLVDSGLEDDDGKAAFTAPAQTLRLANISIPKTTKVEGESGAGKISLDIGYFPIEKLGLGTMIHEQTYGGYGIFPPELYRNLGFIVDGLISHNYLRHYTWTIDFSEMNMIFSQ